MTAQVKTARKGKGTMKAEQAVYAECAKIADKYNKDGALPGIQMGVTVCAAAIASQIRNAAAKGTPMSTKARKGKTLAALEKAAMRWYRWWNRNVSGAPISTTLRPVYHACARHAASKKRKGTK